MEKKRVNRKKKEKNEARVLIPFRVPKEYHRLLRVRLAERGETMQDAIVKSLDYYLDHS